MSKNFLKKENIYVGKKKNAYIGFSIVFILLIITAYIYTIYLNKSIIDNSKTVHYSNLELNEKISFLKEKLKEKNIKIKKYKEDNQELSSMFNKYTDAIKFKIATAEEIKYSLFIKDEEILKLNKEINYYKFLLNSKNKNDLVSIENFKIDLHEKDNSLNYSVLLLSNDSNSKIRGSFKFYYDGVVKNTENKIFRNYL